MKVKVRVRCVGGVVVDGAGRLLLIRRGHPPERGRWSLPGGRLEQGESDEQALIREVREETGLDVRAGEPIGNVLRSGPGNTVFDIRDYAATVTGGTLAAGDDADAVHWATYEELHRLPLTTGLLETLTDWGVVTASP